MCILRYIMFPPSTEWKKKKNEIQSFRHQSFSALASYIEKQI